jgi:putative RecB family exonuclease
MIYSHSRIESFKNCPLQFKYNYIIKPDIVKKQSIEAFLGSLVHETLEKLYTDLKFKKLNTLEELIDYYYKLWEENFDKEKIEIVRNQYSIDSYKEKGVDHITNYYNKYKPFDQDQTIGIELKVLIDLKSDSGEIYTLQGFIDRLSMINEEHFQIHDYKTNNRPKTQEEIEKDKQLALYSIAIRRMYPQVQKIDLIWHFLDSNIDMKCTKTKEDLEDLKKEIIHSIESIIKAIEENNFPAKPSVLCNWCAFKEICPMRAHSQKVKKLPENEFLNEDGVKLVDNYEKLNTLKKDLTKDIDKKLEQLKEAILKYSKENNLKVIEGSNKKLIIKEYDSIKLPSTYSQERKELNTLIKDLNLWNELSDLSYSKISQALKYNMFSNEFKNRLKVYIKECKIQRFYLNKK